MSSRLPERRCVSRGSRHLQSGLPSTLTAPSSLSPDRRLQEA
ncbi:hypothetical protein LINPERHAP2_LOCUS9889 [Linum perenne]